MRGKSGGKLCTTERRFSRESRDWLCSRRRDAGETDRSRGTQGWPSRNNSSREAPLPAERTRPSARPSALPDIAGKLASAPRPEKMKTHTTRRGGRNETGRATTRRATPPPGRSTGRPNAPRHAPAEIALQEKRE